ncbi:hypothetical protein L1887_03921 [Cichorium endivia]|nr:hypothetical protein L1887_03921 [Cichorium endivia]
MIATLASSTPGILRHLRSSSALPFISYYTSYSLVINFHALTSIMDAINNDRNSHKSSYFLTSARSSGMNGCDEVIGGVANGAEATGGGVVGGVEATGGLAYGGEAAGEGGGQIIGGRVIGVGKLGRRRRRI